MEDRNRDRNKHLFYLHELDDYKVSGEDPDVRGWEVKDADNRRVGKVDNLLVNKDTERVVYLDVEVDKNIIENDHKPYENSAREGVHEFINKEGENHVIIPVGMARLNNDGNEVVTNEISQETFAKTNRFRKGENINREYEIYVVDHYNDGRTDRKVDTNATANNTDSSFYERNEFDRSRL